MRQRTTGLVTPPRVGSAAPAAPAPAGSSPRHDARPEREADPATPVRTARVVIVDDTPDLRELLGLALRRHGGFTVVGEAGDGARGIEVVRATRPDVVVLDLAMPVMDGLEALPGIVSLVPDATVVVLSGFGADAMTEQALAAGADDYLQKGIPLTTIVARLDELHQQQQARLTGPGEVARATGSTEQTEPTQPTQSAESAAPPTQEDAGTGTARSQAPEAIPFPEGVDPARILADSGAFVLVLTDDADPEVRWLNRSADAAWGGRLRPGVRLANHASDLARLARDSREGSGVFDVPVGFPARPGTAMARRQGGHLVVLARAADTDSGSHHLRRAIATTAHEIRNPVTVLAGVVEAFEDGDLPPAFQKRLLESVRRQAGLLESITADLLTAAQADRGTLRVDPRRLDVEQTVRDILAPHPDVRLVVARQATMEADPYRFEQMLSNLVSNAHKYGSAPVVVKVDVEERLVRVAVEDSGDGVPEDFRERLFTEYARAEGTQARGTGLGLFVVKRLAEAQGGSVAYEPSVLGGSCFTVTLPRAH